MSDEDKEYGKNRYYSMSQQGRLCLLVYNAETCHIKKILSF